MWTLVVHADRSATLTCDNGDERVVFTKQVRFTDFPLDEVSLWFVNNCIYLSSEH